MVCRRQMKTCTASCHPPLRQMEAELVFLCLFLSFHPSTPTYVSNYFHVQSENEITSQHSLQQWWKMQSCPLHQGAGIALCWLVLLGLSYRADWLGVQGQARTHFGRFPWSITNPRCWSVSTAHKVSWQRGTEALRHLKKTKSLWWKFSPRFLWFCMCLLFGVSFNGYWNSQFGKIITS